MAGDDAELSGEKSARAPDAPVEFGLRSNLDEIEAWVNRSR